MRTILFRAKTFKNEWIYGDLIQYPSTTQIGRLNFCDEISFVKVKKNTVCQFIDMNDKNGKKIFEGDIYKLPTGDKFKIEFHSGCFVSVTKDNRQIGLTGELQECFIEVIGNIHDNPELLL